MSVKTRLKQYVDAALAAMSVLSSYGMIVGSEKIVYTLVITGSSTALALLT